MVDLKTLKDLSLLRESVVLECKLAQGLHGQSNAPFANCEKRIKFAESVATKVVIGKF